MKNNWKWSKYVSKHIIMKRVTEPFIWLFCNEKRKEATHYDNYIVGNTIIIINQWKHLIDRFWKQCQLDYYLDWLNRRITRYVRTNKYQECIPISNNPNKWIYVNRFRITNNWKWRLFGYRLAVYGKIDCCDSTSIRWI